MGLVMQVVYGSAWRDRLCGGMSDHAHQGLSRHVFVFRFSCMCVQDEDDIDAALLEYLGEEVFAECHAALRRLLLCQRSIASLRLAAV